MKKKEYLKRCLLTLIIIYFTFSFIVGELDTSCWSREVRVFMVIITFLACGFIALINHKDFNERPRYKSTI